MPDITAANLILRIEDTDTARNTEEAAAAIYDGLALARTGLG